VKTSRGKEVDPMPTLKKTTLSKAKEDIVSLIEHGIKDHNLKPKDMAVACHICESSWFHRMKDPGDFTLRELCAIYDKLKLDFILPKKETVSITVGLDKKQKNIAIMAINSEIDGIFKELVDKKGTEFLNNLLKSIGEQDGKKNRR
jgi:hypothetical protein